MLMFTSLRRVSPWLLAAFSLLMLSILSACSMNPSAFANSLSNASTANNGTSANHNNSFSFKMVPSPNIAACLPHAQGNVTIVPNSLNDVMRVSVSGLAPNTGYDLFVNELPNKPFGVSWYQSDLETNSHVEVSVVVVGIFNKETFSVSPGGPSATFAPTHQYHLGLWFNDPKVPFNLGCEPGAKAPIVTPFNGEQHAGVQVLNTSNFPNNAGPLSHVSAQTIENKHTPAKKTFLLACVCSQSFVDGRYWDRTSGLFGVIEALSD